MPELSSPGDGPVRPGAMTAVMRATTARVAGPRWVRWAVVRDGRIELERVTDPDREITIGASGDVPTPGPTRTLLSFVNGGWVLRATSGLSGRTEAGSLEALSRDGTIDVQLSDSTRARLELPGGASLLVQLVDRPPAKLVPKLPVSLRGGLLSGADWWFTSFVAASFCMHLGVVAYLMEADWPIDSSLVPDRYAELIYPEAPVPDDIDTPEMDDGDGDEVGEEVADADATEADPSDADPSPRRADARPSTPSPSTQSTPSIDVDAIGRDVAEQLIIAGLAPGSANSAFDALRDGADTQSAAAVFDVVEGTGPAVAGVGTLHERTGTDATTVTRGLGDLDRRPGFGAGQRREGRPVEEVEVVVPRGVSPVFGTPEPEDPAFSTRELIRALRGRMAAVRRCYEHTITHGDPDASGRITLTMEVMPPGHLQGVRAADNTTGSDSLAACVVRSVQTVRVTHGPEYPVRVEFPVVLARQE